MLEETYHSSIADYDYFDCLVDLNGGSGGCSNHLMQLLIVVECALDLRAAHRRMSPTLTRILATLVCVDLELNRMELLLLKCCPNSLAVSTSVKPPSAMTMVFALIDF